MLRLILRHYFILAVMVVLLIGVTFMVYEDICVLDSNHSLTMLEYFMAGMVIFVLAVVLWTWLFIYFKALSRLKAMATAYGRADFSYDAAINKKSSLYGLYRDLKWMGDRIQVLLQSHKELTRSVSHEFRTPLTHIRLSAEALSEQVTLSKQKYVKKIIFAVEELDDLVAEMLTYAKFDREEVVLKQVSTPIKDLVNESVERARETDENKHFVINWEPSDNLCLNIDVRYFKRVLNNLLGNAAKYGRSRILVDVWTKQEKAYLAIEDDGPGIPPAEADRIFEAFVRLDHAGDAAIKGHGLGLAIVKKILRAHGASISLEKGRMLPGARFVMVFKMEPCLSARNSEAI